MYRRTRGLAALACAAIVLPGTLAASGTARAGIRPAAPELLSRNRPVTASSSASGYAAKNAVDGKSSTRWASVAGMDPSWIYVDLGSTAQVSRVRLQWDKSCAVAYRVETSGDATTWTPIFTTTTGDGGVDDLSTVSGSGRYVRVFGSQRCRSDSSHGYSLQELDVYGTLGGGGDPAPNPFGDPYLVSMFNGTTLDGWTESRTGLWSALDGTIHGNGQARGWIYHNQQAGGFRWIFAVRQVSGNHAPTVLIWGTTSPIRDALSAIQFQPPNGGHWDYRPGHNNGGGNLFHQLPHAKIDVHRWALCELVANAQTGVARMACGQLPEGAATTRTVEVLDFKDPTAGRVGPLAVQIHNSGIHDEYRSLYLESPVVMRPDQLITTD